LSKIFVLDTSAIISLVQDITTFRESERPGFAGVLGDNEIVIPRVVLDELDGIKKDKGERGKNASEAARQLESYGNQGSLIEGVETEKGGMMRIVMRPHPEFMRKNELDPDIPDHQIIATALEIESSLQAGPTLSEEDEDGVPPVRLISQDRILRLLARNIYGVVAEELTSVCAPSVEDHYGYMVEEASSEAVEEATSSGVYRPARKLHHNEFLHLIDRENPDVHYAYGIARPELEGAVEIIDRASVDYLKVSGEVTGRNVRQKLLLWTLMGAGEPDPMSEDGIRLITISGPAGSGKSFLALAAAWERLERGQFERIVVTRPMVDVGQSMGYLPGTLEEKVRPWGGPIEDNLRAIVSIPSPDEGRKGGRGNSGRGVRAFDAKTWLEMENRLELVPLTYIRGRTFRRSFVILEEAQNIERGPLKVLLTRLGEGSVICIIGDSSQIDNPFLSRRNNGLVHAINAFRDWPQAVHYYLTDIVRSDLAQAATELM